MTKTIYFIFLLCFLNSIPKIESNKPNKHTVSLEFSHNSSNRSKGISKETVVSKDSQADSTEHEHERIPSHFHIPFRPIEAERNGDKNGKKSKSNGLLPEKPVEISRYVQWPPPSYKENKRPETVGLRRVFSSQKIHETEPSMEHKLRRTLSNPLLGTKAGQNKLNLAELEIPSSPSVKSQKTQNQQNFADTPKINFADKLEIPSTPTLKAQTMQNQQNLAEKPKISSIPVIKPQIEQNQTEKSRIPSNLPGKRIQFETKPIDPNDTLPPVQSTIPAGDGSKRYVEWPPASYQEANRRETIGLKRIFSSQKLQENKPTFEYKLRTLSNPQAGTKLPQNEQNLVGESKISSIPTVKSQKTQNQQNFAEMPKISSNPVKKPQNEQNQAEKLRILSNLPVKQIQSGKEPKVSNDALPSVQSTIPAGDASKRYVEWPPASYQETNRREIIGLQKVSTNGGKAQMAQTMLPLSYKLKAHMNSPQVAQNEEKLTENPKVLSIPFQSHLTKHNEDNFTVKSAISSNPLEKQQNGEKLVKKQRIEVNQSIEANSQILNDGLPQTEATIRYVQWPPKSYQETNKYEKVGLRKISTAQKTQTAENQSEFAFKSKIQTNPPVKAKLAENEANLVKEPKISSIPVKMTQSAQTENNSINIPAIPSNPPQQTNFPPKQQRTVKVIETLTFSKPQKVEVVENPKKHVEVVENKVFDDCEAFKVALELLNLKVEIVKVEEEKCRIWLAYNKGEKQFKSVAERKNAQIAYLIIESIENHGKFEPLPEPPMFTYKDKVVERKISEYTTKHAECLDFKLKLKKCQKCAPNLGTPEVEAKNCDKWLDYKYRKGNSNFFDENCNKLKIMPRNLLKKSFDAYHIIEKIRDRDVVDMKMPTPPIMNCVAVN